MIRVKRDAALTSGSINVTEESRDSQGMPPNREETNREFRRVVEVVARLRAPDGCPWDRVQTLKSIRPHTLEETYEVLEAIDAEDDALLQEELGDLLLQVILYAQIARDEGRFELTAVLKDLGDKLVRRHPHVFGDASASNPDEVIQHWERVKQEEKKHRKSALEGVPVDLPALARSGRLQSKSAKIGLAEPNGPELLPRLRESLEAMFKSIPASASESTKSPDVSPTGDRELIAAREEIFGEVLFLVAELARRSGVNAEDALRARNVRFQRGVEAKESIAD